jgi:hypothetical protein
MADKGTAGGREIVLRQRQRPPLACSRGPMVMRCSRREGNDFAEPKIPAAVTNWCLIRSGEKEYRRLVRARREVGNSWQAAIAPLHPKLGKFDASQFGVEIAFRGDKNFHLRWIYRRLVRLLIAEFYYATSSHGSHTPILQMNIVLCPTQREGTSSEGRQREASIPHRWIKNQSAIGGWHVFKRNRLKHPYLGV